MQGPADAVADEFPDQGVARCFGVSLHGGADVTDAVAVLDGGHALVQAFARHADEALRL